MKMKNLPFLPALVILSSAVSAVAGDSVSTQRVTTTTTHILAKWDDQPRTVRILASPFVFLARAGETFLHSPQILSEAMEGDRALVNKRGVLAPREVPVEDCILSPAD
jgi:hypothetical protein